jgi:hypothetical protein
VHVFAVASSVAPEFLNRASLQPDYWPDFGMLEECPLDRVEIFYFIVYVLSNWISKYKPRNSSEGANT